MSLREIPVDFVQQSDGSFSKMKRPELSVVIGAGVTKESDLHEQIFERVRAKGWIALHGAMSQRTARTLGEWDFIILADNGRVFFVECKSKIGKLSVEQQAMHLQAARLGHKSHVVRCIEDYIERVETT